MTIRLATSQDLHKDLQLAPCSQTCNLQTCNLQSLAYFSYEIISHNFLLLYFPRYELFSSVNSGPVTDRQTESDAYEPTVHNHRCAQ